MPNPDCTELLARLHLVLIQQGADSDTDDMACIVDPPMTASLFSIDGLLNFALNGEIAWPCASGCTK